MAVVFGAAGVTALGASPASADGLPAGCVGGTGNIGAGGGTIGVVGITDCPGLTPLVSVTTKLQQRFGSTVVTLAEKTVTVPNAGNGEAWASVQYTCPQTDNIPRDIFATSVHTVIKNGTYFSTSFASNGGVAAWCAA